jgi:hypothetical protein
MPEPAHAPVAGARIPPLVGDITAEPSVISVLFLVKATPLEVMLVRVITVPLRVAVTLVLVAPLVKQYPEILEKLVPTSLGHFDWSFVITA